MPTRFDILEKRYASLIRDVDHAIRPLVAAIDVQKISTFNSLYKRYGADKHKFFVETEKRRYLKALDIITQDRSSGSVCDLGGFVPYLPVALSKLGFSVTIVDKYGVYGPDFKNAIDRVTSAHSIRVMNLDILNDPFGPLGAHDVVLLLAVVEHFNGTPRHLMKKIHPLVSPGGFFLFEVPNLATFIRRIQLMMGRSPLPDYEDYFTSEYPHMGHNREMTVEEVRFMLARSGFDIDYLDCYDFDSVSMKTMGRLAMRLVKLLPVKNLGQSIIAKARPRASVLLAGSPS